MARRGSANAALPAAKKVSRQAPEVEREPARPGGWQPVASVDVDGLQGEALKAHARRVGVSKRDIEGLTEDRLRQNVKLFIANHFELLAEG